MKTALVAFSLSKMFVIQNQMTFNFTQVIVTFKYFSVDM